MPKLTSSGVTKRALLEQSYMDSGLHIGEYLEYLEVEELKDLVREGSSLEQQYAKLELSNREQYEKDEAQLKAGGHTKGFLESNQVTNGVTRVVITEGMRKYLDTVPCSDLQQYYNNAASQLSLDTGGVAQFKLPGFEEEDMANYQPIEKKLMGGQETDSVIDDMLRSADNLTLEDIDDFKENHSEVARTGTAHKLG